MKLKLLVVILLLALGGLAGCSVPDLGSLVGPLKPDAEAEYYRGIYDTCLVAVKDIEWCLAAVGEMRASGWYELASPGWEWPPSPPTPLPDKERGTPSPPTSLPEREG